MPSRSNELWARLLGILLACVLLPACDDLSDLPYSRDAGVDARPSPGDAGAITDGPNVDALLSECTECLQKGACASSNQACDQNAACKGFAACMMAQYCWEYLSLTSINDQPQCVNNCQATSLTQSSSAIPLIIGITQCAVDPTKCAKECAVPGVGPLVLGDQ